MKKGYMIANIDVHDPETFARYAAQVPATIEKFGGRYVIRGGDRESLEGGGLPQPRIVVLEFDSLDQARAWYTSDDYKPLIELRQSAANGTATLVEGYEES